MAGLAKRFESKPSTSNTSNTESEPEPFSPDVFEYNPSINSDSESNTSRHLQPTNFVRITTDMETNVERDLLDIDVSGMQEKPIKRPIQGND